MVSPAAVAATQPHRKGLGDRAADQLAESEIGRMVLRGQISPLQHLAGQRYAAQWRAYVGTLDGPRWPWRGQGRGKACDGCLGPARPERCACDLARRSWQRSWAVLIAAGATTATIATMVLLHDVPCPLSAIGPLRQALDGLALELGLTNRLKSVEFGNASSSIAPN